MNELEEFTLSLLDLDLFLYFLMPIYLIWWIVRRRKHKPPAKIIHGVFFLFMWILSFVWWILYFLSMKWYREGGHDDSEIWTALIYAIGMLSVFIGTYIYLEKRPYPNSLDDS